MLNKLSTQLVFLFILTIFAVSLSGCEKQEIAKENKKVEEVKNVEMKDEVVVEKLENFELQPSVDASDWQTYRNEEYGFEVKYPKDWFCGRVVLESDEKKSVFCSLSKNKTDYYRGELNNSGGLMINVVDVENVSDKEDEYGIITKTIKRNNFNLQFIYFPFENGKENFLNVFNSIEFTDKKDQSGIILPRMDDWKNAERITYIDKENKFKFNYPNTFSFDNNESLRHIDTVRYINEWEKQNKGPISLDLSVQISIFDNENKLSLLDWFNQGKSDIENFVSVKEYIIGNKKGLKVSENSMMDNDAVFFSLNNGKIVKFHLYGMNVDNENGDNFFVKILESFEIV